MSEFRVEVVSIGKIGKHPNADTLSITQLFGGYPVIFRTGEYNTGDKAVYVSVDALVPENDPRWEFLGKHTRIKAKRLRGIFSMGLLTAADPAWEIGQDVREELGIEKWEPPLIYAGGMQTRGGDNEHCPFDFPVYTDIEGYRKYVHVLHEGEEVVLTEKLHGANGRFVYKDGRLWVGSHKCIKKQESDTLWWKVAEQYDLETRLSQFPDIVLFGEVYGYVQDLKYGMTPGQFKFAAFDALDLKARKYLDYGEFANFVLGMSLPMVPVLHHGPWSTDLIEKYSNGKSTIADHIREGFVVRPVNERWDYTIGRVIVKVVGEDYLLRKGG